VPAPARLSWSKGANLQPASSAFTAALTICAALEHLGELATGGSGAGGPLHALAAASPDFPEFWGAWRTQSTRRDADVSVALLDTLTQLLSLAIGERGPVATWLDGLASTLIASELKPLYFHISSGEQQRAGRALLLLAAAAARGPAHAGALVQRFDLSLSALSKAASPPRHTERGGGAAGAVARWGHNNVDRRPTRACYVAFALAVLEHAQGGAALSAALLAPQLVPLLLRHLDTDPAAVAAEACDFLCTKAFAAGALSCHGSSCTGVATTCTGDDAYSWRLSCLGGSTLAAGRNLRSAAAWVADGI
jgi:Ribosome 60S biogenesis N-terminal